MGAEGPAGGTLVVGEVHQSLEKVQGWLGTVGVELEGVEAALAAVSHATVLAAGAKKRQQESAKETPTPMAVDNAAGGPAAEARETEEQRLAQEAEIAAQKEAQAELEATNKAEAELKLGKVFLEVWDKEPEAPKDKLARKYWLAGYYMISKMYAIKCSYIRFCGGTVLQNNFILILIPFEK